MLRSQIAAAFEPGRRAVIVAVRVAASVNFPLFLSDAERTRRGARERVTRRLSERLNRISIRSAPARAVDEGVLIPRPVDDRSRAACCDNAGEVGANRDQGFNFILLMRSHRIRQRLTSVFGAWSLAIASVTVGFTQAVAQERPVFRDPTVPVDLRVKDLLARLTPEEKALQLVSGFPIGGKIEEMAPDVGLARSLPHFTQKVTRLTPAEAADQINAVQRLGISRSRLGVPILFNEESLHGACWGDATVFPQAIGLGATWNETLVGEVAKAIALELRAVGVRQTLSPVINVSRDPRWGRTEETYGEDPWLTARMGLAYVVAMETNGVVATPKHFVANHGAGGRDSYAVLHSERYLREVDLYPFEVAIRDGRARSIMAAYNSLDGVPCSVNPWLLNTVLRDEWGFDGIVVGDYDAVAYVTAKHGLPEPDLVSSYLKAGLDVDLPNSREVLAATRRGSLSPELLDRSVARLLKIKFSLGLFEEPYVDAAAATRIVSSPAHLALARQAARESIVLLENRGSLLPLAKATTKAIAVIGPAKLPLGGYTGTMGGQWRGQAATLPEALAGVAPECRVVSVTDYAQVDTVPQDVSAAVFVATVKEGEGIDRSQIALPAIQERAIEALAQRKIPVVVLLCTGAPVTIETWFARSDALLQVWYPGQEGARAVAEVLFGDYNPGGRVPMTFPKHLGQVPITYSNRPSGRDLNNYADDDGQPRFPFGFGLSYTRFSYSRVNVDRTVIRPSESVRVSVDVRNDGERAGDEVVQLYLHHSLPDLAMPGKELRGFQRIHLAAGETRTVSFTLSERELATWDLQLKRTVRPGRVDLMIGRSSSDIVATRGIEIRD